MDFWEKTNGTFGVLDIFTKHLFEKKMNFLWVYMPFKRGLGLITRWVQLVQHDR